MFGPHQCATTHRVGCSTLFDQKGNHATEPSSTLPRSKFSRLLRISEIKKFEFKGDHYASIEEIQKSVTVKLKTFPIDDLSGAMKRVGNLVNDYITVRVARWAGFGWITQLFHTLSIVPVLGKVYR